jgi:hypothetical protein
MIPEGTRFIGIAPTVNLKERKSAQLNAETQPYTLDEIKGYKVFTALLTQSGGSVTNDIYEGELTIGVTYFINGNAILDGCDFTNVGAPNNNPGTYFVATGTTPNWNGTTNPDMLTYNTGAPVATVLENTIGNIWFSYDNVGIYYVSSNNLFTENKTYLPSQNIDVSLVSNSERFLLSGWYNEDNLVLNNTNSNGVSIDDIGRGYLEIRVYN